MYPGSYAFGGPGYGTSSGASDEHASNHNKAGSFAMSSVPFLSPTSSSGSGLIGSSVTHFRDGSFLIPPDGSRYGHLKPSRSYPGTIPYDLTPDRVSSRSSMSREGKEASRTIGQRDMLDGSWVCPCGLQNPVYFSVCAQCRSSQLSFAVPSAYQAPYSMTQHPTPGPAAFGPQDPYLSREGYQPPQPRTFGGVPVSPLAVLSKLANHVEELLSMGRDGIDLRMVLVEGDVNLCLSMGMRGLVGREAINPWKCMGVDIPYGPKPPLGTIAGDWSCSCGRENWAKRSVCSRCFPGIEPDYKVIVFQYAEPIFRMIAEQEQHAEIQRGTEWLALEEKKLRREQQQQRQAGGHYGGPSGPTIGRKFIAEFKLPRSRSPYAEANALRASPYGEGRPTRSPHQYGRSMGTYGHMQPQAQHQQASSCHGGGHPPPSGFSMDMRTDHGYGAASMTSPSYHNQYAQFGMSQSSPFTQVSPHTGENRPAQYDRSVSAMQSYNYAGLDHGHGLAPASTPPEPRFHLISSPESAHSFRFSPFSPDPNAAGDGAPWRLPPLSPESPTIEMHSRNFTRDSLSYNSRPPMILRRSTQSTSDEYILTGEMRVEPGPVQATADDEMHEQTQRHLSPDPDVDQNELSRSERAIDPIGKGRPNSGPSISDIHNDLGERRSPEGTQPSHATEPNEPETRNATEASCVTEGELAMAMASTLGGLFNDHANDHA